MENRCMSFVNVYANTPSFSMTHPGSVSEGKSSSTFPLHHSLLYAASASAGLPGLAAARDFAHLPFCCRTLSVRTFACLRVCVCVCVFAGRSNISHPLTRYSVPDMLDRMVSLFTLKSRSGRWAARAPPLMKSVRVVTHMLPHEPFFYRTANQKHRSSQPHMNSVDMISQEFLHNSSTITARVGNTGASWSFVVTFCRTAGVCVFWCGLGAWVCSVRRTRHFQSYFHADIWHCKIKTTQNVIICQSFLTYTELKQ